MPVRLYEDITFHAQRALTPNRSASSSTLPLPAAWPSTNFLRKSSLYARAIQLYVARKKHLAKNQPVYLYEICSKPPFHEYHFIDADPRRANQLQRLAENHPHNSDNVHIYSSDCNQTLLKDVFPRAQYRNYKRALCLLDPYNINLRWEVIETAGKMGTVDMFLNFMIMDINRNVLRQNLDAAVQNKREQLTRLWGDESWIDDAYDRSGNLFGNLEKVSNERFEKAWRSRLKEKAGFKFVSEPLPMKTKTNSVIYYLYFASQKDVAHNIVREIFTKYR